MYETNGDSANYIIMPKGTTIEALEYLLSETVKDSQSLAVQTRLERTNTIDKHGQNALYDGTVWLTRDAPQLEGITGLPGLYGSIEYGVSMNGPMVDYLRVQGALTHAQQEIHAQFTAGLDKAIQHSEEINRIDTDISSDEEPFPEERTT